MNGPMDSISVRIQYQTGPCPGKKEYTSRLIIMKTGFMPTRNRQRKCCCITRTFVCESHQHGITEENSER
jgi:hypothetical protein